MKDNTIGQSVKVAGIFTIFVGLICGFALGKNPDGDFSFLFALIYWVSGAISGLVLMALGEIVQLLQNLCNANKNIPSINNHQPAKPDKQAVQEIPKHIITPTSIK